MHWGFYVLFAFLGLLILLMLTRVKLGFSYLEQFGLWIGFGLLHFTLVPSTPKKKQPEKKKTKKEQSAPKEDTQSKKPLKLQMIIDYAKLALNELGKSAGAFRIDDLMLHAVIGSDDAASTALSYGALSAALSAFYPILAGKVRIKKQDILLDADFSGNASLDLRITISAMLVRMLFGGLRVLRVFIKKRKIQEIESKTGKAAVT